MVRNRELAEWLGLTYADMLVNFSFGAVVVMFFVQHAGFDVLLALAAIALALVACPVGMKRDPQVSNFTNTVKRVSYPSYVLLVVLLISFHYIVLPTAGSYMGLPRSYYITSGAMNPTLTINDRILVNQGAYRSHTPHRGDIVVFRPTETLVAQGFRGNFVFRIIGLANEQIEIRDGKTLINQISIEEPYILEQPAYQYGPVVIPANSYFVLGDNRNNAYDSQDWGFIPHANLAGKVNLIYWPLNRYRSLFQKP